MPLSLPTGFANNYQVRGTMNATYLKIDDGSDTYYFSDSASVCDYNQNVPIYPVLVTHSGVGNEFDWQTKRWNVSTVTVRLHNITIEHAGTTATTKTVADILSDMDEGADVEIRILSLRAPLDWAGLTTEAALIFEGVTTGGLSYDEKYVTIKLQTELHKKNTILPETYVGDIYSGAPNAYKLRKIPIVYGEYTGVDSSNFDRNTDLLGLAKAEPVEDNECPKMVLSDHVCDAFTEAHLRNGSKLAAYAYYSSATLNDSGRTTYTVDYNPYFSGGVLAYFQLRDISDIFTGLTAPTNEANFYDGSDTTYMSLLDNVSDNGTTMIGHYYYGIDGADVFNELTSRAADCFMHYQMFTLMVGGGTMTIYLYSLKDTQLSSVGCTCTSSSTVDYHTTAGTTNISQYDWDCVRVRGEVTDAGSADGTIDNYSLLRGYEARIQIRYIPTQAEYQVNSFAACKGYEFASWLNDQSSSDYSVGDVIEDPCQIIQSLLRDQMGFVNADVDQSTFEAAEDTALKMRINFHSDNEMTAFEAIQQICEQSTGAFVWHPHGQAAYVDLMTMTGQTSGQNVVTYGMLKEGKFKVRKTNFLINKLTYYSRWQEENGDYADISTIENTTSQTTYGVTNHYIARWPNIAGTTADKIAYHLIKDKDGTNNNSDGLWANRHVEIEFEVAGFQVVDTLVGEQIVIDHESFDPQFLCYGESWSGKRFKVTKRIVYPDRVSLLRAMELFDTY